MVGGIGRALVGAGVIVLLFVAYQLWGTGLQEARAQRSLSRDFEELLATTTVPPVTPAPPTTAAPGTAPPPTAVPPSSAPAATTTTTTVPAVSAALPIEEGDALARIEIPAIGVDKIVVAGVSVADLRKGPGHYPQTPLPGQRGNAAIAGHRTTYGAPFHRLDELEPGDEIVVTTLEGRFRYLVERQHIVAPTDLSVLDPTEEATLTLTSCHPKYSARQRIVVHARLEADPPVAPAAPTIGAYDAPSSVEGDDVVAAGPDPGAGAGEGEGEGAGEAAFEDQPALELTVDPLADGWFADPDAWWPAAGWALVCLAIANAAWLLGRRWRKWPTYVLATPVFLAALYVWFGDVARLLPPNL